MFSFLLLAFTPTSEFYEDRGPKFIKDDIKSIKNKNLKDAVVPEHIPDGYLAVDNNVEELKNNLSATKHSSEALPSDLPRCVLSSGAVLKEEKDGHQVPPVVESSPGTVVGVGSSLENIDAVGVPIKEEVWFIAAHSYKV